MDWARERVMEDKEQLLTACVRYFKERKVYDKLFLLMREKYRSLGHFGGSAVLTGLDGEDCRQLGGFFQKNYAGKSSVTISASAMEKALADSRFAALGWEEILQRYFGEELISRKAQKSLEEAKRLRFFSDIAAHTAEGPGREWLCRTLQLRGEGYTLLMKNYRDDPAYLGSTLQQVLHAISKLPLFADEQGEKELLAVFAARTTKDPHFFDAGTLGEQLLTAFLKYALSFAAGEDTYQTEEKAALLFQAGILKDPLSNYTLAYGIRAYDANGQHHEGVEGFALRREPVQLTLLTLGNLKRVCAREHKRVYIVENPAVFYMLVDQWRDEAVVCGNGQVRLATLVLLDLFDEETRFYYAGDFDPEGLLIAQRLKERYRNRLHLWNYSRSYYEKYKSDVPVSEKSLRKLDKIYFEELQELKEGLLEEKKAAYQESMLQVYLKGKSEGI